MRPTRAVLVLPLAVASVLAPLGVPAALDAQFRYPPIQYPYRYAAAESDLRILVKPKDAAVYVDGYLAGKVDEFDGAWQRLHVEPGQHEIVIYLAGYRSLKEHLYLTSRATRKIQGTLERLAPGEALEPEPEPLDQSERPRGRDESPANSNGRQRERP